MFYLFGAFLVLTAIKVVTEGDEDEEFRENARRYQEQLEQVQTEVRDIVAALPADHRVLLT